MKNLVLVSGFLSLLLLWSCSTDVDLNAPPKDIWAVFGVLNSEDSVQWIRVSRGYLPESDALEYARENDLSAKGLIVNLSGGGQTYTAIEVDSVAKDPEDGLFFPTTTLYKIQTADSRSLDPGEKYELTILNPGDDEFALTSETTIPAPANFLRPAFTPGPGAERCLRQVDLVREYKIEFTPGQGSAGYEVRVFLDYQENGEDKTAMYGPTAMFTRDVRCIAPGLCYQFREKEIIGRLSTLVDQQPGSDYSYGVNDNTKCNQRTDLLPDVFRFEVTSMDRNIVNYRQANDPAVEGLNTSRPEFSNIQGPQEAEVLGLFGSINTSFAKARLNECGEYLLGFRSTRPLDCIDL
jgi:hypothetical protein